MKACFGKTVDPNYKEIINKFEECWNDIYIQYGIPFINKAHIIIAHVPQVIKRTGKGLFNQSEEVVEATHALFAKFWERYKVLDLECPMHGE